MRSRDASETVRRVYSEVKREESKLRENSPGIRFTCGGAASEVILQSLEKQPEPTVMIDLTDEEPKIYVQIASNLSTELLKRLLSTAKENKFSVGDAEVSDLPKILKNLKKEDPPKEEL